MTVLAILRRPLFLLRGVPMQFFVRLAVPALLMLSAHLNAITCSLTAQVQAGPSPSITCIDDEVVFTLGGYFEAGNPTTECTLNGSNWQWTFDAETTQDCSAPGPGHSRSGAVTIVSPNAQTTQVKVAKNYFTKAGRWKLKFKVTANAFSSNCGYCTSDSSVEVMVNVVDFAIEIHNTPATTDDYVQLQSTFSGCPKVYQEPARAKVFGCVNANVTLTNPDNHLNFPSTSDLNLSLPVDTWVPFTVAGVKGSSVVEDAKIQLIFNEDVCFEKPMTVFWFANDSISGTKGNAYTYDPATLTFGASPYPAITMDGHADIKPDGLNASASQIINKVVGMVQNSTNLHYTTSYINPTVTWKPGVAAGTTISFPASYSSVTQVGGSLLDSLSSGPLYNMALTNAPASIGAGDSQIQDNPSQSGLAATFVAPAVLNGVIVADVTYSLLATIDADFMSWTVIFDTGSKEVTPLIRRGWQVSARSDRSGDRASVDFFSHRNGCPQTSPATSNTALADPANTTSTTGANQTATK